MNKPPIGIVPRFLHEESRINDLKSAIGRCLGENRVVNPEWIEEYNDLIKKVPIKKAPLEIGSLKNHISCDALNKSDNTVCVTTNNPIKYVKYEMNSMYGMYGKLKD